MWILAIKNFICALVRTTLYDIIKSTTGHCVLLGSYHLNGHAYFRISSILSEVRTVKRWDFIHRLIRNLKNLLKNTQLLFVLDLHLLLTLIYCVSSKHNHCLFEFAQTRSFPDWLPFSDSFHVDFRRKWASIMVGNQRCRFIYEQCLPNKHCPRRILHRFNR